jgi:hypothetical protein
VRHPTHRTVGILDDVGARQAAHQRGRELQPTDGEGLFQPLEQARRGVGVLGLEPGGLLLQFRDPVLLGELVGGEECPDFCVPRQVDESLGLRS